ncbi:hypothetical protein RJ55_06780 [Drechmeria coniospora]|nr:hypothetical protein RJ55_06780 [Drechmeria coniospora]
MPRTSAEGSTNELTAPTPGRTPPRSHSMVRWADFHACFDCDSDATRRPYHQLAAYEQTQTFPNTAQATCRPARPWASPTDRNRKYMTAWWADGRRAEKTSQPTRDSTARGPLHGVLHSTVSRLGAEPVHAEADWLDGIPLDPVKIGMPEVVTPGIVGEKAASSQFIAWALAPWQHRQAAPKRGHRQRLSMVGAPVRRCVGVGSWIFDRDPSRLEKSRQAARQGIVGGRRSKLGLAVARRYECEQEKRQACAEFEWPLVLGPLLYYSTKQMASYAPSEYRMHTHSHYYHHGALDWARRWNGSSRRFSAALSPPEAPRRRWLGPLAVASPNIRPQQGCHLDILARMTED